MVINFVFGILSITIAILFIRALRFKPKAHDSIEAHLKLEYDQGRAIERFRTLLRLKTVSYYERSRIDQEVFLAFKETLKSLYPIIFDQCTCEYVGETGILLCWRGKSPQESTILMSHYDVVPVNEELWHKAPFEAALSEGAIWARGTLDTKGTLVAIMEAVDALISEGFVPEHDLFLSFSGDEEISGPSAPAIVELLHERGIKPSLVLDEGGAVVDDIFPGVSKSTALVGVGEKGYMDLMLSLSGQGGHASAPPAHTLLGRISKAAVAIEAHPFKGHLTQPVAEMFDTLGRYSSFGYRIIFANLWLFMPLLDRMFRQKGGQLNALLRTTCALTKSEGSKAFNVLPPSVTLGMNMRLLKNDTTNDAITYLKSIVNDPEIDFKVIERREASTYADTHSDGYLRVKRSIGGIWPEAIVSPYLMVAASDSRHFTSLTPTVLKFSAMRLSSVELGLIHGNDERVTVDGWLEAIEFFGRLIRLS